MEKKGYFVEGTNRPSVILLLAFPNLEVEELATAILLVRPNCKQTDDNVTSGKSCFPFEAWFLMLIFKTYYYTSLTSHWLRLNHMT
jgi:hypothetical protein